MAPRSRAHAIAPNPPPGRHHPKGRWLSGPFRPSGYQPATLVAATSPFGRWAPSSPYASLTPGYDTPRPHGFCFPPGLDTTEPPFGRLRLPTLELQLRGHLVELEQLNQVAFLVLRTPSRCRAAGPMHSRVASCGKVAQKTRRLVFFPFPAGLASLARSRVARTCFDSRCSPSSVS